MQMVLNVILGLLGGLGVFLYGINLMSEGLQRAAGERLKKILAILTKNRFLGVLLGLIVTGIIQSSSATTVMVVGLVNAGIMSLNQAVGVIMGANIGTTMTAQIIAFNIIKYAPIMIAVGAVMALFVKNRRWKLYGEALFGLGLIFLGIDLMAMGVKPLRNHQGVMDFFRTFSSSPVKGVLAGLIMTCILQSSSATIGLTQVLASQGMIDLSGAIPLILGDNIGTTITAQLAALNTNRAARRAAMAHTMFNVIGAAIFLPFVYMGLYQKLIIAITAGSPEDLSRISRFIANSHTAFNAINTLIFLCFTKVLVSVSIWLVPIKPEEQKALPLLLEPHLLDTPVLALQLVRKELVHMVEVAEQALVKSMNALLNNDIRFVKEVRQLEDTTDDFQHSITEYLIGLSERDLTTDESEQLPTLIHSVNDMERVGDHAENLAEIVENMQERGLKFSEPALNNLKDMFGLVNGMFPPLKQAIENEDAQSALKVLSVEKQVNALRKKLDEDHVRRLMTGECDLPAAHYFMDAIHNLEKIGDHMKNVAQTAHNLFTWSKGKAKLPKDENEDDHKD
jgi:phosphate:Na+ symporter